MARQTSKKINDRRKVGTKTRTKASSKQPVAIVYEARCKWGNEDVSELLELSDGIIGKVIVRENEIAFDWISDEKRPVEHTRLSTIDGVRYVGYTEDVPGCGDDRARIEAILYSNSQGHILLGQGTWELEGRRESFIIQFHSGKPVEE
jgi:hypothetical protein